MIDLFALFAQSAFVIQKNQVSFLAQPHYNL